MLNLKKLLTKILTFQVKSIHVSKSVTFASGQGIENVSYTLPTNAEIISMTIRSHTNPDWIFIGIAGYSNSSATVSYNNTYKSAISGVIEVDILYR